MCGIAGRTLNEPGHVGEDLTAMMAAQRHRGWDSTGFALYGTPRTTGYVVRALLDDRAHLDEDPKPSGRSPASMAPISSRSRPGMTAASGT